MALDEQIRRLFDEIKYKQKFPPRAAAMQIKSRLVTQGLGTSTVLAQLTAGAYVEVAEKVLDEFTRSVIDRASALDLADDSQLRQTIGSTHQGFFDEVRSLVIQELRGLPDDYVNVGVAVVDDKRREVWDHLERMIALRSLSAAAPARTKEKEQKFGILLSPAQAARDFEAWATEARELGNPIALLFVDLDHFKRLNERLTHAKVDQTILPEAQKLLAKLVHSRGEAYRYGGEEFVLVMPNLDEGEAAEFAEKVRRTFEQHRFQIDGGTETITVSIGVARSPANGQKYDEVLAAANRAALEAKKTRNTVRIEAS